MKWVDRTFRFDLPVWMYPNLVERLRGTPVRLRHVVAQLSEERLTRRFGDQWSIQENAGHLLDLEPLWAGRMDDILRGAQRLREADLTNRQTHEACHNDKSIEDLLRAFGESRGALVQRLDDVDDSWLERAALHPRLNQPMRLIDLAYFVAEHDDHHLAQITRLKRQSLNPSTEGSP